MIDINKLWNDRIKKKSIKYYGSTCVIWTELSNKIHFCSNFLDDVMKHYAP